MVNQEILGGLINALERGESLKKSMMSFYNAGYKKEEIEEAAMMTLGMDITSLKELLNQNNNQVQNKPIPINNPKPSSEQPKPQPVLTPIQMVQPKQPLTQPITSSSQNISVNPTPTIQNPIIQPQPPKTENQESQIKTKQKVSDYSTKPKKKKGDNLLLILLILLLVFLAGVLISLFVFKNQIITFFSRFLTGSSS
jgi:FtsZ-interacting cell division protein ZipA